MNLKDDEYQNNLNIINRYMKKKQIHLDLRLRVKNYFEYLWYEENAQNEKEENKLIEKLSISLKEELLLEGNGDTIKSIPILTDNFSELFLRKLVTVIKQVRYVPGDIIYQVFLLISLIIIFF